MTGNTSPNQAPTVRPKRIGIVLVLLSVVVCTLWLITGIASLEPLVTLLAALGALLLAL